MTPPEDILFPGVARPMPDRVDYRFTNGWTGTGDLPCREALRASLPGRSVARPEGPFPLVYPGLDGQTVDFSRFCHRPTFVRRGLRCRIDAETAGEALLRVETPGAVHLWIGTSRAGSFEPFTRNRPALCDLRVPLAQGANELTLLLEDLHERDTNCFFGLVWRGGPEAETGIDVDEEVISSAAALLDGLRANVFVRTGDARLASGPPPARPAALSVRMALFPRGGLVAEPGAAPERRIRLGSDACDAVLFTAGDAPAGCLALDIAVEAGEVRLERRLGVTHLPAGVRLSGPLARRKADAADAIVRGQGFDPSVAVLLAGRGEAGDRVARILDAALTTVEERHDCADFSLLPMLRIWRDARESLAPTLAARLKSTILGFRYWMTEPGDDVMWFWSENHVLCFHVAELIACRLFPDSLFPNGGRYGRDMAAAAEARLARWFDSIEAHGFCEWNSAAYYPIDLLALFTLHDMAPQWRPRAAALLDCIFAMTALHTSGGVPAGSQGRCYEKELLAGPATELGSVAAIALGGSFHVGHDRAAALFCLSDYTPPESLAALAEPEAPIEARYTQGLGHAGLLSLWKSRDGQISTASGLAPGTEGHQAQIVDLQIAAHPMARIWINHPGEEKVWGERRPSLLAGSHVIPAVAQRGPLALLIFDLDREWTKLRYTQAFAARDAFESVDDVSGWRVFRAGRARAALWCSVPLAAAPGFYSGSLWRAAGDRMAWALTLALPEEDDLRFAERLVATRPAFDEASLVLTCRDLSGIACSLDGTGRFRVEGTLQAFAPMSPVPHVGAAGRPLRPWSA